MPSLKWSSGFPVMLSSFGRSLCVFLPSTERENPAGQGRGRAGRPHFPMPRVERPHQDVQVSPPSTARDPASALCSGQQLNSPKSSQLHRPRQTGSLDATARVHQWQRVSIIIGIFAIGSDRKGECRATDDQARNLEPACLWLFSRMLAACNPSVRCEPVVKCLAQGCCRAPAPHLPTEPHVTMDPWRLQPDCLKAAGGPATTFLSQNYRPSARLSFARLRPTRNGTRNGTTSGLAAVAASCQMRAMEPVRPRHHRTTAPPPCLDNPPTSASLGPSQ